MKLRLGRFSLYLGYELAAALSAVLILDTRGNVLCCILAAGLHELGHLLMMLYFRVGVRCVSLRLFDVLIEADAPADNAAEAWIALGGPLMNLLLAAIFLPCGGCFGCG